MLCFVHCLYSLVAHQVDVVGDPLPDTLQGQDVGHFTLGPLQSAAQLINWS